MKKYSLIQKVTALALTLVMVIGLLPNFTLPAVAAEQADLTVTGKDADPSSFNNWEDYYGNNSLLPDGGRGTSTWKAGGVWTDKSVYTDSSSFPRAVTMDNQQNNFLVALSALASNKEIVGQSSTPTDTMLVLDLSQSMDTSGSVDDMIEAANETIDTLLKMNVNNRIGVVLYSGNTNSNNAAQKSSATVILPLERYTTTTTTTEREDGQWVTKYQYLTVSGNSDTTVSVASGTRNSRNVRPTGSKNTIGGTYIQNGLFQAWEEFEDMTDKGVVQSGTQAGVQRIPILVLMSDGAPTIATTDYYNVGTSNTGNGMNTTDRITFLTQLTAAWVKGKVGAHYNNTAAKLYTLGLGTANDANATAVLNPIGSNNTLVGYWNNYNNGTNNGDSVTITGQGNQAWRLTYQTAAEAVGRNYVDMYKSASNSADLIAAFKEIVAEIGLQSAYSPTLVASGIADMDGYITVQDELGAMMQVKDVKGILLGNTLFSGAELARSMDEGLLGSSSNPKDYGNVFVQTVKERIGITDTSVAQNLIRNAYHSNQLNYVSASDYSNYIGWYGGSNNEYLGFWQESYGYGMEGAPAGAKYINKSYGYLGGSAGTDGAADMMHIVVMVRTEITTGHQTVLFKIPASLIPMVEYKVELEGDSLETATEIKLTVDETDPIRLVYEVGLPDDVNNINIDQKVAEYEAASGMKVHKDTDGNYVFYANSWDTNNDGVAPDISGLNDAERLAITEYLPESHFVPNTANERFYIQEDAVVYTRNGNSYTPVTSGIAANGTYYFARTIVTIVNGTARAVTQYEQLQSATVANASNFQQNASGQWEVKAGTIRQQLSNVALEKDENKTGTIANTDQLWVNVTSSNPSDYNIYSFLGNNGKFTVVPTTGIKVTKNVTEYAEGDGENTPFAITVTLSRAEENAVVTDANGDALPSDTWSTTDKKTFVLKLKHGQSAYITGLAAGTTYTVTEETAKYTYTYAGAGVTVAGTIVEGVVTNEPVKPGNLYITKEVVHAHGGEIFPTGYEFEFKVTFLDAGGNPIANTTFQLENNYDASITELTTDANGVMEGKLKHGETVYIKDIPAGAVVTVEEVNIPANYTSTVYRSRNQSGGAADTDGVVTIVSERNATVVVTNTYTPDKVEVDISFDGTKNFDATHMSEDSQFTFKLQKYENGEWNDVDGKVVTITGGTNASEAFAFDSLQLEFTEPGTHSYQIVEVEGDNSDITYDRSVYTFSVNVTLDSNGDFQVEVVGYNEVEDIFEVSGDAANGYTVTTVFNNEYHTTATSIAIEKSVDDKANSGKTSAGFIVETYEASVDDNGVWTIGNKIRETVTDAQGEALLVRSYDNTDFENVTGNEVTYHFIIKEKNAGAVVAGWKYDATEYHVTVVLNRDAETQAITADFDVVQVPAEGDPTDLNVSGDTATITFANTYDPGDAEVDLDVVPTVAKDLKGRDLVAGEFTFAIFKNGESSFTDTTEAIMIGTNDADGHVSFAATDYGVAQGLAKRGTEGDNLVFSQVGKYEYDIVEVKGSLGGVTYDSTIYDMVVEVSDNGDGTLKAVHYFEDSVDEEITFNNAYTVKSTEVVIDGIKTLKVNSGVKELNAGDYTFYLYNEAGEKIGETTNLANGSFKFDAIEYDADDIGKTYTYVVKEQIPDGAVLTEGKYVLNGVTYSAASFTVTVKVNDNGDGTLSTEVTGNGAQNIKFVNEYASNPVSVTLSGKKTLEDRDLTAGEFTFAIYKSNAAFNERTPVNEQITHDAGGNITFSFGALGMGYHYYVVKEMIPEERAAGIHYDASEYYITIQVTDAGDGQMSYLTTVKHSGDPNAVNPTIAFKNIYEPDPGELILSGNKTYEGGKQLEDDVFSVGLYDVNGDLLDTALVKADGSFTFLALEYNAEDVGETYTYTVKEIIPDGATDNNDGTKTSGNNIYDATVYTVEVKITDNDKDGALEIVKTVTKNGSAAELTFNNTFIPDPIDYVLEATKTYEKGLKGGDFKFKLTSADNKSNVDQVKYNDADGNVVFDKIDFPAAGTYTFHVEEIEKVLGFIDYSTAKYLVTIEVVNENGVLRIVEPITVFNLTDNAAGDLTFVNTYMFDGEGEVTLSGTKTLTGDRTTVKAGEFEFGLYDAEGKLVESVKNDANGNFAFTTLEYDETDVTVGGKVTETYTVKEIAGDNARYEYDDAVYTVEITIKDNDQGGISVTHTITDESGEEAELSFTNKYTNPAPVTYTPAAEKKYNKVMTGGEFTFSLTGEINGQRVSQTKKNGADGKVLFDTLSFPEAGTYTFVVKEIEKLLGFINYSTAEHEIVVKVIDTRGVLSIESVTINDDPEGTMEFTNTYKLDGEATVTLSGTKTLTGDRTTVKAGEFEFGLYDAEGKLVESVKNDANGNFAFTALKYDETVVSIGGKKEFTYTVKEIAGSNPCMTYDTKSYTVVITVEDNDQGGVKASYTVDGKADGKLAFTNTYTDPEDVVANIYIQKKVVNKSEPGIGLKDFTFVLEYGSSTYTDTSDADGKAGFQITLGAKDIGQTYEFKVYEKRGNATGVTYDDTAYTVKIQIGQNADGSIKTVINDEVTGSIELEFTNVYEKPVNPVTGDDTPLFLLISMMLISGGAMVTLLTTRKKRYTDR